MKTWAKNCEAVLLSGMHLKYSQTRVLVLIAACNLTWGVSASAQPEPISIFAAGDVMPGRGAASVLSHSNLQLLEPEIKSADIAFANLEGAASTAGRPRRNQLLFEPEVLRWLRGAGLDVLSLANNHALDNGEVGLALIQKAWRRHGLVGAAINGNPAEPVRWKSGGRTVAWLAASAWGPFQSGKARVHQLKRDELVRQIRQLSGAGETVLVSLHWGEEYRREPTAEQRSVARALVDAGATAVIGHHTHVAGLVETYRGRPIFYSLGNFVFDHTPRPQSGLAATIRLEDARVLVRTITVQPDATVRSPQLPASEKLLRSLAGKFLPDSAPQQVLWSRDKQGVHHLRLFVWDGQSWRRRAAGTHPAVEQLRTGDVDGDGRDEIWLQLRQRSKLDVTIQKRLHIYRAEPGRGFRPVWRGSGLSRPFAQWALLYRRGNWAAELLAVETDPRPEYREFQWLSLYRWNGFGFRRVWDHPVRGRIHLMTGANPAASVNLDILRGTERARYRLWSVASGAKLSVLPSPLQPSKAE